MHFIIKISGPKKIQSNSRIGVYTPSNHPKALFTAATTAFLKASDGVPVSTPVTTTQSDVLLLRRVQLQSLKPQKLHRSSVDVTPDLKVTTFVPVHICNFILIDTLH